MTRLQRGIALGALQCLLLVSVAGKYAWDRERLPRVWVKTAPIDPYLPIRGRYVSLRLQVEMRGDVSAPVSLSAENGSLVARPGSSNSGVHVMQVRGVWALAEPVAYFVPEHAADPTRMQPGEELWVEVSVPRSGPPRPVHLGVKRDGGLRILNL
jgi:hypothetical protein